MEERQGMDEDRESQTVEQVPKPHRRLIKWAVLAVVTIAIVGVATVYYFVVMDADGGQKDETPDKVNILANKSADEASSVINNAFGDEENASLLSDVEKLLDDGNSKIERYQLLEYQAVLLYRQGKYQDAGQSYELAAKSAPESRKFTLYINASTSYRAANDTVAEKTALEKAFEFVRSASGQTTSEQQYYQNRLDELNGIAQ
jgi:tetratricopeptide (TPR) repeat protein